MTLENLKAQLSLAEERVQRVYRQSLDLPQDDERSETPADELTKAQASAKLIRDELTAMATGPLVVPIALGISPELAVSGGTLHQHEVYRACLTFNGTDLVGGQIPTAIVDFDGVRKTQFGFPSEDDVSCHPLYGHGVDLDIGAYEVINSPWLADEKNRYERKPDPEFSEMLRKDGIVELPEEWGYRHFIFAFHDSTFECLALDMLVQIDLRGYKGILLDIMRRLG